MPMVAEVTRNESGHIVQHKGMAFEILDWLSQDLGFTYAQKDYKKLAKLSRLN